MTGKITRFLIILTFVLFANTIKAATVISSSTVLTQSLLNSYSWPVTINGGTSGTPVVITLGEEVTLSNSQNYFILNGDYINFNGNNHSITISGVSFYNGMIKNGSSQSSWVQDPDYPNDPDMMILQTTVVNGFSNIYIYDLTVNAVNSDIASGAGWIGQSAFSINATNGVFENCSSNGPIRQGSGGIVGEKSGVTVKKSSFLGTHIGGYAGGIFGEKSSGTAINCYSSAPSLGNRGGGIFGGNAVNATATNCYSFSTIVGNSGGIFGGFSTNCNATNCYSLGTIGSNAGGVYGGNSSGGTATNCYSANGNWNNDTANGILTGTDGTMWNNFSSPYKLIAFATSITSNTTIDQAWINSHINNLPILLNSNVTVTISENLTFNDANMYFAIRDTGVTIDGNGKTITLSNITNYRGLVNNGDYLAQSGIGGYSGSVVKSIGVISDNSTLKEYCGWIGQQSYGNGVGFSITNCYSTGDMINAGTGGILGSAFMNGTISNCYSLGVISGNYSAGIAATMNNFSDRISNCYANGIISNSNANGICRPNMMMGGTGFTNCYISSGTFNTTDANSNLTGTDGTIWNATTAPYTLAVFPVILQTPQTPSGFSTVAYEGFDYSSGSSLLNASGGSGWSTNWSKSYMYKYLKAGTTGFTYTGLTTAGLKAEFDNTCYSGVPADCNAIASLGRSFSSQNEGIVYFQFISVFEASAGGGTPTIRLFNGGTQTGGIGANSGSYMSILDASLTNVSSSSTSLSAQNLVVVRINYDLNKTEMWVNPDLSTFNYLNPTNPSASVANFAPAFDNFSILIRSGSIDEISIFKRVTVLNKNGKLDTDFSSAVNKNGAINSGNGVRLNGKSL